MKRLFLPLLALATLAMLLVPAGKTEKADAGYYYWSRHDCKPWIWWNERTYGVWQWLEGYSEDHGAHLVRFGWWWDVWHTYGGACGWLGAPLTNATCVHSGYAYQNFEGGRISANFCP